MAVEFSEDLLRWAKQQCRKHKVKFRRHKGKHVILDGLPCAGYFDFDSKVPALHITTGRSDWEFLLAHEVCHMVQWAEQTEAWKSYCTSQFDINKWLEGEEYHQNRVNNGILATITMERECEEKAVELLSSFGKYDRAKYIKKANAYTLFYLAVKEHRKWYLKNKSPYFLTIWKHFPDIFDIDIHETYNNLKHLYLECIE